MQRAFEEICRLIRDDAKHRSGFRLQDATPLVAATHATAEVAELLNSVVFPELLYAKEQWRYMTDIMATGQRTAVKHEIADVLGCLFHLAIMLGITESDLEEAVLLKLAMRFVCHKETA